MEVIMKKRAVLPDSGRAAAAAMAVHSASRAISKPKIRIIHIFAPEIIKTDVANFRDLVQRLTGKPPPPPAKNTAADEKGISSEEVPPVEVASIAAAFDREPGSGGGACRRVKEEEEELESEELNDVVAMWNDVVGIEGFFEELGEFPLLPSARQIMLGFGETQFV